MADFPKWTRKQGGEEGKGKRAVSDGNGNRGVGSIAPFRRLLSTVATPLTIFAAQHLNAHCERDPFGEKSAAVAEPPPREPRAGARRPLDLQAEPAMDSRIVPLENDVSDALVAQRFL